MTPRAKPTGFAYAALALLAVAALAALLLPFATRLPLPTGLRWLLDLAVHWQWLHAAVFAFACIGCAGWRRRWLLWLPACALPWLTATPALPMAEPGPPTLRVAFANVHVSSEDPSRLLAWLAREPVDVLAIGELSPGFADALSHAAPAALGHRSLHPQPTPWGIGLLSRYPLRDVRLLPGRDGVPRLEATIDLDRSAVRLVVLHPKPPMTAAMLLERDRAVAVVASARDTRPRIVLGDLNATPWSRPLQDAADGDLLRATTLAPTWPAHWTLRPGIPIDHVLASPQWAVRTTGIGPDIGSDHRPVRAELRWRAGPAPRADR